jgi:hypothetical protein
MPQDEVKKWGRILISISKALIQHGLNGQYDTVFGLNLGYRYQAGTFIIRGANPHKDVVSVLARRIQTSRDSPIAFGSTRASAKQVEVPHGNKQSFGGRG